MSDELTPKQAAFAAAFFECGNAAEAYRRAYDVAPDAKDGWIYVEACQLLDHPKVALRLKDLRAQADRLAIYNLATAMDEYEEARQLALREAMPAAAVSATAGKVKLLGLDKPAKQITEHTGKDGGPIETADKGTSKLLAYLDAVSSRAAGVPSE